MAITVNQQPASGTFASDNRCHGYLNSEPVNYSCTSDAYANANFRYDYKLYTVDGLHSRIKQPPWTDGAGVTTVNDKLKSLYEYTFLPTITAPRSVGAEAIINYRLECTELYDTLTPATQDFTKANAMPFRKNNVSWGDFIMTSANPGRFLTDMSGTRRIRSTDQGTLTYLNGAFRNTADARYISKVWVILVYVYPDASDLTTYKVYQYACSTAQRNAQTSYSADNDTLQTLTDHLVLAPAGPYNLNRGTRNYLWDVVSGSATYYNTLQTYAANGGIIDSTTACYSVRGYQWFGAGINADTTEVVWYDVVDSCTDKQPIRIAWENYYGGTDYFNFYLISRKSIDVERTSYRRDRRTVTSGIASYDTYKGGETIYDIRQDEVYLAQSDVLEPSESLGLESLWTSKNVYAYVGDTWYPVILVDTSIPIYDAQEIDPIRYSISFRKANRGFSVAPRTVTGGLSEPTDGYIIN